MAIEKEEIKLTNKRSSSYTDPIIIDDNDKEEKTLEPKKKKQSLGSWWNYVEAINELSCVVKGSSKTNDNNNNDDVPIRVDSFVSFTDIHEKKNNFIDLSKDDYEIVGESACSNKSNGQVTLEELGVTAEDLKSMPWEVFDPIWEKIRSETMDPWLGGYVKEIISLES